MALDESSFDQIATDTLQDFMEIIEDHMGDDIDVEMQGGILTLELESGAQYVINKHAPNCQIWMSSPQSGATHYGYDEDQQAWISTRGGADLRKTLAAELEALMNMASGL